MNRMDKGNKKCRNGLLVPDYDSEVGSPALVVKKVTKNSNKIFLLRQPFVVASHGDVSESYHRISGVFFGFDVFSICLLD